MALKRTIFLIESLKLSTALVTQLGWAASACPRSWVKLETLGFYSRLTEKAGLQNLWKTKAS